MLEQLNIIFFRFINHLAGANSILDWLAIFLAQYTPYIFIIVLIYLWFKANYNYKNIVLYATYTAILAIGLNFIISLFYFHPRPFVLKLGRTLIQHGIDSSFPSDHTTFMLAIACTFLYFMQTRKIGLFFLVFGLLAGFSRVYVGVHFPLDIIGSLVVASLSAYLIVLLKTKLQTVNQFIIKIYSNMSK